MVRRGRILGSTIAQKPTTEDVGQLEVTGQIRRSQHAHPQSRDSLGRGFVGRVVVVLVLVDLDNELPQEEINCERVEIPVLVEIEHGPEKLEHVQYVSGLKNKG